MSATHLTTTGLPGEMFGKGELTVISVRRSAATLVSVENSAIVYTGDPT